jgi:hypothetical protein
MQCKQTNRFINGGAVIPLVGDTPRSMSDRDRDNPQTRSFCLASNRCQRNRSVLFAEPPVDKTRLFRTCPRINYWPKSLFNKDVSHSQQFGADALAATGLKWRDSNFGRRFVRVRVSLRCVNLKRERCISSIQDTHYSLLAAFVSSGKGSHI